MILAAKAPVFQVPADVNDMMSEIQVHNFP